MFLHAGGGVILRDSSIIGIFDLDGKMTTPDTADFLRRAERAGETCLAGDDLPKCFLLTAEKNDRKKQHITFSCISAGVLANRGDALTGLK